MKKFTYILFCLLFLNQAVVYAYTTKKVFILHSYSQEYQWTKKQHEGLIDTIKSQYQQPVEICTEYLDTKRVPLNNEYQKAFLTYLLAKYKNYTPDAIYVSDDDALNFVIKNAQNIFSSSPVIFSGINNLSLKQTLDKNRYAGVFEIKEIEPNINLIHTFSPQTRDIWFVGDASRTYNSIETELNEELKKFPKLKAHFVSSTKLDDVLSGLKNLPPRSFVLLTTIGGFTDSNGSNITLQESIGRLSNLQNLIILSMEDAYIRGRVVGGYTTNGNKQGSMAAEMILRILNNQSIKSIESVSRGANTFIFDRKELVGSRLILSEYIAQNALILNKEDSFYIKHQTYILNIFFIVSIIMVLSFVVVYFVLRARKQDLERVGKELVMSKDENRQADEIVSNMQAFARCVYWHMYHATNRLYFIDTINLFVEAQADGSLSLDEFLNYFVPIDEHSMLRNTLDDVQRTDNEAILLHSVELKDGTMLSVRHKIGTISKNMHSPELFGIIQILEDTSNV